MQLIPNLKLFYCDSLPCAWFMMLCTRMCQEKAAEAGLIVYLVIVQSLPGRRGWRRLMNNLRVESIKECTVQKMGANQSPPLKLQRGKRKLVLKQERYRLDIMKNLLLMSILSC